MTVDFEAEIRAQSEHYQGKDHQLVALTPFFYRLLTRALEDPELPGRLRPMLLVTIAYYLLPSDAVSEDLAGARGFLDDLFLAAVMLDRLSAELGSLAVFERNWEGPGALRDWIAEILAREGDLVGEARDVILWYVGYEHLFPNVE